MSKFGEELRKYQEQARTGKQRSEEEGKKARKERAQEVATEWVVGNRDRLQALCVAAAKKDQSSVQLLCMREFYDLVVMMEIGRGEHGDLLDVLNAELDVRVGLYYGDGDYGSIVAKW